MRIMGIDYGKARIGVSISDSLLLTASPLTVIDRKKLPPGSIKELIKRLKEIAVEREVSKVVLGYPKNMNNTVGGTAVETEKFAERLEKELQVPVVLWDERLSSAQAERALLEADLSRKKRRERIDGVAAALILQSYLEAAVK